MDVCESVKALITDYDCSLKRLDSFTGKEGIVIRDAGSSTRYTGLDTRRVLDRKVQVVVRRRSERQARDICEELFDRLAHAYVPSVGDEYRFIDCAPYTDPQELALEEHGFYAWDFRLIVQIEPKGDHI